MHASAPPLSTRGLVLREDHAGIARLTLNRAQHLNALSSELLDELEEHLDALARDTNARVVVIAAAGRTFCPGHDLKEMLEHRSARYLDALFAKCCRIMLALNQLPQPVIARVHGTATAAGCQLVAACDLAVASSEARFATSGIDLGLFCSTPAGPISRTLGRKRALQMLLTGEFIDAQTALAWGLVNRVVPAEGIDAALDELCTTLCAKAPAVLASGKRFFYRQLELSTEAAYQEAAALLARHMLADEGREGVSAFLEHRRARGPGPTRS